MRATVLLASSLPGGDLQEDLGICLGEALDLPSLAARDVIVAAASVEEADAAPPAPSGMDLYSLQVFFPYYSDKAAYEAAWVDAVHMRRGLRANGTETLCSGCFLLAEGASCPLEVKGSVTPSLMASDVPDPEKPPGFAKLPWPTIAFALGGALVAMGLCRLLDAARPGTAHFDVFRSGLALSDFVSDVLFILTDLARDDTVRDLFMAAAGCLVLSFVVNLALVLSELRREGTRNAKFTLWLQGNLGTAAPVLFLSFTNVEALTILTCRVVPALSAPLHERTVQRINVLSMATNVLEVPQRSRRPPAPDFRPLTPAPQPRSPGPRHPPCPAPAAPGPRPPALDPRPPAPRALAPAAPGP